MDLDTPTQCVRRVSLGVQSWHRNGDAVPSHATSYTASKARWRAVENKTYGLYHRHHPSIGAADLQTTLVRSVQRIAEDVLDRLDRLVLVNCLMQIVPGPERYENVFNVPGMRVRRNRWAQRIWMCCIAGVERSRAATHKNRTLHSPHFSG